MSSKIKTILSQKAEKTFEELAFLFVFSGDEADFAQADPAVAARVSFSGVFSGTLVMKLSAEVLPELTANMLGVNDEEETTLDQQYDALKETINVVCGNLLPELGGDQEVFNIDPPQIVAEDEAVKKDNEQSLVCNATLAFDEGICELFLFSDDQILINLG